MINDYIFVGVFFIYFFLVLNQIQTIPLVQQKPNRYSCPDHCTDVPLNFELNKEGLNYIYETSNDAWCRQ